MTSLAPVLISSVAVAIRQCRLSLDLSEEDFAEDAALPLQTIKQIEDGTTDPSLSMLVQITKALDISMSELFEIAEMGEVVVLEDEVPTA
jgi:DNA-binding XRE family transcriptional regulator